LIKDETELMWQLEDRVKVVAESLDDLEVLCLGKENRTVIDNHFDLPTPRKDPAVKLPDNFDIAQLQSTSPQHSLKRHNLTAGCNAAINEQRHDGYTVCVPRESPRVNRQLLFQHTSPQEWLCDYRSMLSVESSVRQVFLDHPASYYWGDSEVVLACIHNELRRFRTNVPNLKTTVCNPMSSKPPYRVQGDLSLTNSTSMVQGDLNNSAQGVSDCDPSVKKPDHIVLTAVTDVQTIDKFCAHHHYWRRAKHKVEWLSQIKSFLLLDDNSSRDDTSTKRIAIT